MRHIKSLFIAISIAALASSCSAPKNITYIQDLKGGQEVSVVPSKKIVATPGDRLSIIVHSKDPELAQIFNLPVHARSTLSAGEGMASGGSGGSSSAYTVDSFGDIEFPNLGTVHVGGLTRQQIASTIRDELIKRQLLKDPTVIVEFLDHSITVLGDVNRPGRLYFDRDELNLIEAIGLAGDLRMTGMRTNVKVVREENGEEKAYIVDLTDAKSLYSSPVFYLQQNDLIYVEPNNTSKRATTPTGNTLLTPGFWISIASFAMTVYLFVKSL